MDFLNRHVWLKRALMLLAILVATPFAGYLLLFIEVAGLEVAFACLLIMLKPFLTWAQFQIDIIRATFKAISNNFHKHLASRPTVYFSHAAGSAAFFAITGVMFVSVAVWLPLFMVVRSMPNNTQHSLPLVAGTPTRCAARRPCALRYKFLES
nr:hypothetical protein [Rhodospirillales bacterium]